MTAGLSFSERLTQEARLAMLQELGRQHSGRLPIRMFEAVLELDGHADTSPEWIETQLAFLERMGVVARLAPTPGAKASIAQLTELGRRFLDRRVEIAGIKAPDFRLSI